jgi:hypothetical protein
MMKIEPNQRLLPITCHHFVLGELLQYLIRPLAEIVESYRLALDDDVKLLPFDQITAKHACGVTEIHCPFRDLSVYAQYVKRRKIYCAWLAFEMQNGVYYEIDCAKDVTTEVALKTIVNYILQGRLPCEVLQDCMLRTLRKDTQKNRLYIQSDLSVVELKDE